MNLYLMLLLIALSLLLIILFFFYLHKDQALTFLEAKYSELAKLERNEHELNRLRDDFTAMMVHELRSPLAVMKGSADLLLKEDSTLSVEQKYTLLSQIEDSSGDLLQIVTDLLDVSKIESGRLEIKKERGNINDLLEDESEYYEALAHEKGVVVNVLLEGDLPEVSFDRDGVKRVMNNLLSNALKFTESGGKVEISSRKIDGTFIEVCISDTGRGVPEGMKGKLFNKFVQVDTSDGDSGKGTGLGLAIAKGIVEAHGGRIWIEDNKPKGSKFLFVLPLS